VSTPAAASASSSVTLGGRPWGVAAQGLVGYVAVEGDSGRGGRLVTLDLGSSPAKVLGSVDLPTAVGLAGAALTPDGDVLLVAVGQGGASVFDTSRVRAGRADAEIGQLVGGRQSQTVEVAVSPDGRFAAASNEGTKTVSIFDLQLALRQHFAVNALVTEFDTPGLPVGVAFTPDGKSLFVDVEKGKGAQGMVDVFSVGGGQGGEAWRRVGAVSAGCDPVRLAIDGTSQTTWVTARESNAVLAFDTTKLESAKKSALRRWTRVGSAPVGVAASLDGSTVIVNNSNRFAGQKADSTATVLDAKALMAGKVSTTASAPTGAFPRDAVALRDGGFLVSDFNNGMVTVVRGSSPGP
jgi:DNA-binding beta-propeller fold protein YncE